MAVHNTFNLAGPRIQENGNIHAGPAVKTITVLIIPLATIIGHGIYIVLKFLS